MNNLRIGLFGVGLEAYWTQFAGLHQRLLGYVQITYDYLLRSGAEVVNLGLIDTPQKAVAAGHNFRSADVDLIVMHVTTYALSSTVLPAVRHAKVPVLALNLQPDAALDYSAFNALRDRTHMTGEWLAWCSACSMPEIANVLMRCDIPFHQLTGTLKSNDPVWKELSAWVDAARVVSVMEHNRCGLLGHLYNGMMDIACDTTAIAACLGGHMEVLEVDDLVAIRKDIRDAEITARIAEFRQTFEIQPDCAPDEIRRAAHTSVALDKLMAEHELGSMAYYYRGNGIPENEECMTSVILGNSLLTSRGIPVAGEYEIKNVQAMKILDAFGAGGSFTEYYAADFADDVVLMGHDGPGHLAIAEGKAIVRPLSVYHGKVGRGLSVEMSVRHGPVTLLALTEQKKGGLGFVVAEGESCAGPVLQIGNTNSRYRFPIGAKAFIENWNTAGPAHHCAIGIGHIGDRIQKLAALLAMPVHRVC